MKHDTIDKCKQEIAAFLKSAKGTTINKCYVIYTQIFQENQAYAVQLFSFLLSKCYSNNSSKENEIATYITAEQKNDLAKQYGQFVNGTLDAIIKENLPPEEFYEKLWNAISTASILDNTEKIVFAIYYIWIDKKIPYFQIDAGLRMSDEEFSDTLEKVNLLINKAQFISSVSFEQRTEQASLLVDLLEKTNNTKEKAVLMAQILVMNRAKLPRQLAEMFEHTDAPRDDSQIIPD